MWKQELDDELENFRSNLGIVPKKIKDDVVGGPKTVPAPTDDQRRRWKEELDEELGMLRLNPRSGNTRKYSTGSPPPTVERRLSEQQRRWKQELEVEMRRQRKDY
ncbi:unnamed protein product [Linum trigynum]|uniref:Uncharacterized protein n=1 Tax=Linum trigynum TaxID=586398 RepID=A0AAV2GPR0_9ROSI